EVAGQFRVQMVIENRIEFRLQTGSGHAASFPGSIVFRREGARRAEGSDRKMSKPRAGGLNNEAGMRHYGQHGAPHANRPQRRPTKAVKTMVVIQSTLSRALPTGYCETPSGMA